MSQPVRKKKEKENNNNDRTQPRLMTSFVLCRWQKKNTIGVVVCSEQVFWFDLSLICSASQLDVSQRKYGKHSQMNASC